jgi:hypothetical protein
LWAQNLPHRTIFKADEFAKLLETRNKDMSDKTENQIDDLKKLPTARGCEKCACEPTTTCGLDCQCQECKSRKTNPYQTQDDTEQYSTNYPNDCGRIKSQHELNNEIQKRFDDEKEKEKRALKGHDQYIRNAIFGRTPDKNIFKSKGNYVIQQPGKLSRDLHRHF